VSILSDPQCKGRCNDLSIDTNCKLPLRTAQAQAAFPELIERPLMRTMHAQAALPEVIERPLMWGLPSGVGLSQTYVGIQDGCHQVVLVFFLKHDGLWLL